MKKTMKFRISVLMTIAVFLLSLFASVFVMRPIASAEDAASTATLTYAADSGNTVVTGIDETSIAADTDFTVNIPAAVTRIDLAAFAGKAHLVGVTFANGSALESIGDFAFSQTGLTRINLPNGLKTVGAAAFAQSALKSANIPASVESVGQRAFGNMKNALSVTVEASDAEFGDAAFDANAYVVANSRAVFDALEAGGLVSDGLTYPVTVEYNVFGTVVATETRYFGKDYAVENVDGELVVSENPALGTATLKDIAWYATPDCDGDALTVADVTAALAAVTGDKITLYSKERGEGAVLYLARSDLEYNGVKYGFDAGLNDLLVPGVSDRIPASAKVTLVEYTDPNGNTPENPPIAVCNAGHYELTVAVDGEEYPLVIDVARRAVNIGEMTALSWKVTYIGSTETVADLRNETGMTLYIYTHNDTGAEYPSRVILGDAEKAALNVSDTFTTRLVRNSVARKRESSITVGIAGGQLDEAFTVEEYDHEYVNTASAVGSYTAAATVVATDNYTLVLNNGKPTDDVARGVEISVDADGRSAFISKKWYIVKESNSVVDGSGNEYEISDRVYGDNAAVVIPRLLNGDVDAVNYGTAGDKVSLTLIYNDNTIIGAESFTRRDIYSYINDAMPAGEYVLRVYADDVISVEGGSQIAIAGVDETFAFTVEKREIDTKVIELVDRAIKGREFVYVYDGNAHLYDEDAASDVDDALASGVATFTRRGTVWESSVYDALYGEYNITFNLARMLDDTYYAASALPVATSSPDRYTVFYKVSAPNYYASTEGEDVDRTEANFTVVNVMSVKTPELRDKTYNGSLLTADITDNVVYTVTENVGGVNVGPYIVKLTLINPDFYMWEGQTLDDRTADTTVTFDILAANNGWTVEPGVAFWVEGSYDHTDNAVIGSARFGSVTIVITDSDNNVVYNSADGTNKLESLGAGTYLLSATVAATENYDELRFSMFVNVFEKPGLPWWGIMLIVIGALAVVAIVLLILGKKGVFTLLTGKLMISIRTKATIDATIAAVRASKVAAESKASVAAAEANDKAQERAQARKAAQEAERAKSTEEKAAELEAKAQSESERADKIKAKAEAMQARATAMKESAATEKTDEEKSVDTPEETPAEAPAKSKAKDDAKHPEE